MASQGIYKGPECRCHIALLRITKKKARKGLGPLLEERHQTAFCNVARHGFFNCEGDADAAYRSINAELPTARNNWSLNRNGEPTTSFAKFPRIGFDLAGPAPADAAMLEEIVRCHGFTVLGKITGRCHCKLT